jgi:hypothetical protein
VGCELCYAVLRISFVPKMLSSLNLTLTCSSARFSPHQLDQIINHFDKHCKTFLHATNSSQCHLIDEFSPAHLVLATFSLHRNKRNKKTQFVTSSSAPTSEDNKRRPLSTASRSIYFSPSFSRFSLLFALELTSQLWFVPRPLRPVVIDNYYLPLGNEKPHR